MVSPRLARLRARIGQIDSTWHAPRSWELTPGQVRLAAATAALCGAFMATVAMRQAGPTVHPDEFGFLANGQVLIGHHEAQMPTGSFYPAGYGIVTGLAALATGSLDGAYRTALIVNVVLAVVVAWAAARLAVRGFGASRATGRVAGLLVFVAPGTIVSAMFAWPETAARLAFIGLIGLVAAAARRRNAPWVLALAAYTGLLPGLHGRFTLMLPIICLVIAWWGWKRDVARIVAVPALGVVVVGYWLSYLLNRFVKSTIYAASYDQENRLLRRLVDPTVWPALVRTMTGQSWYLVATSFGVVGVAVAWAVSRARADGGRATLRTDPERLALAVTIACTVALIFTGGLQLLYGARGDHLIYGRYVEILVPVLWVIGVVALERASLLSQRAWFVSAVSIAAVAVVYVVVDWGDGVKGGWVRKEIVFPNIVGTDAARYLVPPGLLTFGALFAAVALVLWRIARARASVALVAMVVVLAAGAVVSGQRSILTRTDDFTASGVSVAQAVAGGTEKIGFDVGVRNDRSYYYLRHKLHPVLLDRFPVSGPGAEIPDDYRCVYAWWNKPPTDGEWESIADEPLLGRVLFRRVGATSC